MRLLAILACVGFAAATCQGSPAPDAFLDQPLPARLLPPFDHPPAGIVPSRVPESHTYPALVRTIESVSPKPVVFPPGWMDFVSKHEKKSDGGNFTDFFLHFGLIHPVNSPVTIRSYLQNLFDRAGLTWRYDAPRDAIITDFRWRVNDSRSSRDLLEALLTSKPTHVKGDPWPRVFDSLLNKPENYPRTWRLRFCVDDRSFIFGGSDLNLLTQPFYDSTGREHVLFVNDHPELCNPGPPGSFSYYLFDRNGRFESGGLCMIGYRCFAESAWVEPDGHHLTVRVYLNGRERQDSTFVLQNGLLSRIDFQIEGLEPHNGERSGLDSRKTIFTTSED